MIAARITMLRSPVAIRRQDHNAVVAWAEREYTSTVTKSSKWRRSAFHIAHSWFHIPKAVLSNKSTREKVARRKEHLFLGLNFLLFRRRSLFHLDSPRSLLRLLCQLPRLALTLRLNAFLFSNSQQKKHHSRCLRKVASYHCSSRLIVHHY